jgi:hypothetical protein
MLWWQQRKLAYEKFTWLLGFRNTVITHTRSTNGNPPKKYPDALRLARHGRGAGEPNPMQIAPEKRKIAD